MNALMPSQQQISLPLPVDSALLEELMLKKASELYRRSRLLNIRYPSFKQLMDDPIAGRCMRMSATHLLRL